MQARRAFRFGVACARGRSRHDWREKAQKAEQLGYATFLVPDHLQDQLAPVPALLAAADATTTIRIGSHVFANDLRHPVMLAKEAATLDLLSDGRFELGLGAGWLRAEYDQAGVEFAPPGVRVAGLGFPDGVSIVVVPRALREEKDVLVTPGGPVSDTLGHGVGLRPDDI